MNLVCQTSVYQKCFKNSLVFVTVYHEPRYNLHTKPSREAFTAQASQISQLYGTKKRKKNPICSTLSGMEDFLWFSGSRYTVEYLLIPRASVENLIDTGILGFGKDGRGLFKFRSHIKTVLSLYHLQQKYIWLMSSFPSTPVSPTKYSTDLSTRKGKHFAIPN